MKEEPYNSYRRCSQAEYEQRQREKALRIIWRHLKDLIEQQLLAVQIGQYALTDMFLHGIMFKTGGRVWTIGQMVRESAAALPGTDYLALQAGE
jgi:fucose 4-O-acetylase-like acetyltransferase